MIGYKLFRRRKDGTLGPLFINARLCVPVGQTVSAKFVYDVLTNLTIDY